MTYIVAVTGGIGSGKTTITNIFAKHGVPLVDADIIARQVVEKGSKGLMALRERYGSAILDENGELNRRALRHIIFNNKNEQIWVEQLLHPMIHQQAMQQLSAIDAPYVLWIVPLLFENNLQQFADRTLVIDVNSETQMTRTMARDNMSRQQVEAILATQISREQRCALADDLINNDGDLKLIEQQVQQLHQQYLQLAQQRQ